MSNVVEATLSALSSDKAPGQVINVGCGGSNSLLAVVVAIEQASGLHLAPRLAPQAAGDVMHSCANICLTRELLGYTPGVSFTEGVGIAFEAVAAYLALPHNKR